MIDSINIVSLQEKELLEKGLKLPIMEEFYTIQGEGYNTGKAAYFIRVGGCDVGCHWCDVKESWNPNLHPLTDINVVIENMKKFPAKSIVVTGGEPSIYNLTELTQQLKKEGVELFIETSGSHQLTGTWDWVCLSPKKNSLPLYENYKLAHELKVIVFNNDDFKFAEEQAKHINTACKLYLQPEWSKMEQMLPSIIEFVKNNPKWNISLQTHKYMRIP